MLILFINTHFQPSPPLPLSYSHPSPFPPHSSSPRAPKRKSTDLHADSTHESDDDVKRPRSKMIQETENEAETELNTLNEGVVEVHENLIEFEDETVEAVK